MLRVIVTMVYNVYLFTLNGLYFKSVQNVHETAEGAKIAWKDNFNRLPKFLER